MHDPRLTGRNPGHEQFYRAEILRAVPGHFAERHFAERHLPTDIMPKGKLAENREMFGTDSFRQNVWDCDSLFC